MRAALTLVLLLLAAPALANPPANQPPTAKPTAAKPAPPKPHGPRPVLVEMFVSQSCASCPPADALLQQLAATDKHLFPLSYNVTYWNNLGWTDTDASKATTERQFWYAGLAGSGTVYTPEAVVDGTTQLIGSHRAALTAAIAAARANPAGNVPITIQDHGPMVALDIGAGPGTGPGTGQIVMIGYDAYHATAVTSGENAGRTVSEINVVRSITPLGGWLGAEEKFTLSHPAGQHVAVLLQDKSGAVLGLAADAP